MKFLDSAIVLRNRIVLSAWTWPRDLTVKLRTRTHARTQRARARSTVGACEGPHTVRYSNEHRLRPTIALP